MKRRLLIGGLALFAVLAVAGYAVYKGQTDDVEKRGSASEEFDTSAEPQPPAKPKKVNRRPWPMYRFDRARSGVSPFGYRPPFRRLWSINAHDTLEFPPSIGYNRVYLAQQKGMFFALNARNGRVSWKKSLRRCAASSPAIGKRTVYVTYMDFVNCPQSRPGATGFMAAWDARTGKERWRVKGAPFESSPLLIKNTLYAGSWDRKMYAINARNGRKRWAFESDQEINTSPAYSKGRIFFGTDAGTVFALNAKTGKRIWSAQSNAKLGSREFFYATPTVAYGRVYIGNTDGTMYVFGAKSGRLLWARPLGTYIYAAAAIWKRRVYVGTYDGKLYALDAATGDTKWQRETEAAVHGAPTVMGGLVYYATCSSCGRMASRSVKGGPDGTTALNARNGRRVWHFNAGKFASPVVADDKRVYITGRAHLFALAERKAKKKRKKRARD